MKKIILLAIVCFLMPGIGYSADFLDHLDTLQCGDSIVSVGGTKYEAMLKCGEPSYQDVEGSKETVRRGEQGSRNAYTSKTGVIEQWYYNRGPNDFIYVLTFEGGTLRSIRQVGYGK